MMRLTILGSGTSSGVPLIFCRCLVCRSKNPKNHRLRASAWIEVDGVHFLIDTSTDLRQQALKEKIPRIDTVLMTHPHADHVHGIDELRSFNFIQKQTIPLYANQWTYEELKNKFSYIFSPQKNREGGGIPLLKLHLFDPEVKYLKIKEQKVIPLPLQHGSKQSIGYRIKSMAYVTDCSVIPELSLKRMKGLSVLILDCLRLKPHSTHFNLEQALATVRELKPKKTFLTHLSHDFDYFKSKKLLPKNVFFAYDGLRITIKN